MQIIKFIINFILSLFLIKPLLRSKIFIFCFHDISNPDEAHYSPYYSTPTAVFKKQLDFISDNFEIISIERLSEIGDLDKKKMYAIITFDDGFNSVLTKARPLLEKKNLPFTIFLNQSAIQNNQLWTSNLVINKKNSEYLKDIYEKYIDVNKETNTLNDSFNTTPVVNAGNIDSELLQNTGKENKDKLYANLEDLKSLKQNNPGVTYGNHTANHYNLSKCDASLQDQEIYNNHQFIKDNLNIEMMHFAVPFGKKHHFNESTLAILSKYKYNFIFTTNPTYVDINHKKEILFPRIPVTDQTIRELTFRINRTLFKKIDL